MSRSRLVLAATLALLALLLAAACTAPTAGTGDSGDAGDAGVRTITESTCPEGADCVGGFRVDGVLHARSCGAVRVTSVTDTVLARGTYEGEPAETRLIEGVDPSLLVAVNRPGGLCDDDSRASSPWSMVLPQPDGVDLRDAVRGRLLHLAGCRVSPQQQQRRNRCPVTSAVPTSPQVQTTAPAAAYDALDWPSRPGDLECERGMGRAAGVPPSDRGRTFPSAAAALQRAQEHALAGLTGPDAAATLTPALRQLRPLGSRGYEELFFRDDVTPVAWVSVSPAGAGSWRWAGFFTCRPSS